MLYLEEDPRSELWAALVKKNKDARYGTIVYGKNEKEIQNLCKTIYGEEYIVLETR